MSYIHTMLEALGMILTWPTPAFLFAGVSIGFVVGILPGLGGPVALAILIPLTFDMSPVHAIAFLLGMLSVTQTAGGMTSILFGVPGSGTAAALVLDGFPLSRKGQAGRALGASLAASLMGSWISAAMLAALLPIARPLVLIFGTPEFFMLILLAFTLISALNAGSIMSGAVAVALGLLLSTVGPDPQTGTVRFAFGYLGLADGLHLVPVTIGLFAIPVVVDLAGGRNQIAGVSQRVTGVMDGAKEAIQLFSLVARSSLMGSFVSILPGLGGQMAQWLAYGQAAQTSKTPGDFGKGAIEGVVAPASANDTTEAGGLIPTVTFGIPGTASMALLLGAFVLHGVTPGPAMMTVDLALTLSFVWMISVASLFGVALGFLVARPLAAITTFPSHFIAPCILVLLLVGSYSARNSLVDIWIMLAFGLVGLLFNRIGYSKPAMLLGFVLGGLAERYFFLSVSRYGFAWLGRPWVLFLSALCLVSILISFRRRGIRTPADDGESASNSIAVKCDERMVRLRRVARNVLSAESMSLLVTLVFGLVTLIYVLGLARQARMFPTLALVVLLAGALGRFASVMAVGPMVSEDGIPVRSVLRFMAWFFAFLLCVLLLGLPAAGAALSFSYAARYGRRLLPALLLAGIVLVGLLLLSEFAGVRSPTILFF